MSFQGRDGGELGNGEVPSALRAGFPLVDNKEGESSLKKGGSNPVVGVHQLFWERSKCSIICSRRKVNLLVEITLHSGLPLEFSCPHYFLSPHYHGTLHVETQTAASL